MQYRILTNIKRSFKKITIRKAIRFLLIRFRIIKYKILSRSKNICGKPKLNSPLLLEGAGLISFGKNVILGVPFSPSFYNTYIYMEARSISSNIRIGNDVMINNNACIISEGEGIEIGDKTLIGPDFKVYDSDFHDINPLRRLSNTHRTKKVIIGMNVFIGSNVTILKGVEIGNNTIIGSGSVVTQSIPTNVIAAGNPCKIIKKINF